MSDNLVIERVVDGGVSSFLGDDRWQSVSDVKKRTAKIKSDFRYSDEVEKEYKQFIEWIMNCGITETMGKRAFNQYGKEAQEVLLNDPYRVIGEIPYWQFKHSDSLAQQWGWSHNNPKRLAGAIRYALKETLGNGGHTYIHYSFLAKKFYKLFPGLSFEDAFNQAQFRAIDEVGEYVTSDTLYEAERNIADLVFNNRKLLDDYTIEGFDFLFDEQKRALETAMSYATSIICGFAGTGKTTVIRAMIEVLTQLFDRPVNYLLLAPTGLAARHITNSSGLKAYTIDKFLFNPIMQQDGFDLIIVDEVFMVDSQKLNRLLQVLDLRESRLVFTGDNNQLKPISAGQPIFDLLWQLPTAMLTENHRSESVEIVDNSQKLLQGLVEDFVYTDNFRLITDVEIYEYVKELNPDVFLVTVGVQGKYGSNMLNFLLQKWRNLDFKKWFEHQRAGDWVDGPPYEVVYNPYINEGDPCILMRDYEEKFKRGMMGRVAAIKGGKIEVRFNELNSVRTFEKEQFKSMFYHKKVFRVGDKVMQTENTRIDGVEVVNGDLGVVTDISPTATKKKNGRRFQYNLVTVAFGGDRIVEYQIDTSERPREIHTDLTLAYCLNAHKAQGQQWSEIVCIFDKSFYSGLMTKGLTYMLLTRPEKKITIIGNGFKQACYNEDEPRMTMIPNFIWEKQQRKEDF